ncbi:hypothetical protein [Limimaricola cinnabarinus]|uniref:Uncharacterized protein n=2 Tax=Limimaricola cinnabarinus TaxID=1125964 RepID=U2YHK9_9RHOB|nr:hypothetical protein [Limimaricola cinnabarinus]GAD54016.1 hypothetical protein MBELCI_0068 [Limimaricola cinnabarinus LL-001]
MVRYLRRGVRVLRIAFSPSEFEERSGFDYIWAILLLSGLGVVMTFAYKLIFPS